MLMQRISKEKYIEIQLSCSNETTPEIAEYIHL